MSISVTTVIKTTQTVLKIGNAVFEYIRDDQTAELGLLIPIRLTIEGPGVGIGDYQSPCNTFTMLSPNINTLKLHFRPFPTKGSWWNGPDGLPKTWKGGAIPASLPHDAICRFIKPLAAELGITEDEVWKWSSGVLASVWKHYGHYRPRAQGESWLAFHITRNIRRPYGWLQRILGFATVLIAAATLTGCSGCAPLPDWRVTQADPIVWEWDDVVTTNNPPTTIQE